MHLHLRDGEMLQNVAKLTSYTFSGAVVMPNLVPPVRTKEQVIAYKERIMFACGMEIKEDEFDEFFDDEGLGGGDFEPLMTLFYDNYSEDFLDDVRDEIFGIKLYPAGITTNSEGGVSAFDVEAMRETLEAMARMDIPLLVHGETDGFVMDREAEFMSIYELLASSFPNLKIIMEYNPFTAIILTGRDLILGETLNYGMHFLMLLLFCIPIFFLALAFYRVSIPIFVERLSA